MKNKKTKKGSVLAYALIVLAMLLAIATSMSFATVIGKKSASATDFSVQAYQTADSGVQLALKNINNNLNSTISGIYGAACSDGVVSGLSDPLLPAGASYELSFSNGAASNCGDLVNTITNIESTATYRNTVRSISVEVAPDDPCGGVASVTDADGNSYNTVRIGEQCWLAENLRTNVAGSFCNPAGCGSPWGRLYNWNAAMDGAAAASGTGATIQGVCPAGWHIPSDYNADANDDFQKLSDFLGGDAVAGGAMKRTETPTYWDNPNTDASGNGGFAGVAAGWRNSSGSFLQRGRYAYIWSSSERSTSALYGLYRYLSYDNAGLTRSASGVRKTTFYFSVRCVKD